MPEGAASAMPVPIPDRHPAAMRNDGAAAVAPSFPR